MGNKVEETGYIKGREKSSPDVKKHWNNICKFIKKRKPDPGILYQAKFSSKDIDPQTCRNSVNAEHVLINALEDKLLPSKITPDKEFRTGEALTKIL